MTVLAANGPDSFIWWDWVDRHRDQIQNATFEHLRLTLIAVVVGFAISAVLAVMDVRAHHVDHGIPLHHPEPRPVRSARAAHRFHHTHG